MRRSSQNSGCAGSLLILVPDVPTWLNGRFYKEGQFSMATSLEVSFHGIQKSMAIEQLVREKVAKLQKHFGRMTSCRVAIEVPQRSADKPKVYQVKIEISVPRRSPVVVCHDRKGSHANADLPRAIRDAFEAA